MEDLSDHLEDLHAPSAEAWIAFWAHKGSGEGGGDSSLSSSLSRCNAPPAPPLVSEATSGGRPDGSSATGGQFSAMELLRFISTLLECLLDEEEVKNGDGDSDPHIHLGEGGCVLSRHATFSAFFKGLLDKLDNFN